MNNSILTGNNVMPMKGRISENGGLFSLMRNVYKSSPKTHPENNTDKRGKNSLYQDNSLYLINKKNKEIGKETYKSPLSFNSNPTNDVKNAKKRMRSSGAIPPKYKA
uniref:Uncharacterized protein n=1 Tax=viral metagenome TaxID=1070528 RepID=A0A6C0KKY5_9ZZZZ